MPAISKTDYLLWRACPKNAWLRIHKPCVYHETELTEYEQSVMDMGIEVERAAHGLFPDGTIVESSGPEALQTIYSPITSRVQTIFRPVFELEQFVTAVDVLCREPNTEECSIYEVKATTEVKEEYVYDLAFQVVLLRKSGLTINRACLLFLNAEYIRQNGINLEALFKTADLTVDIEEVVNAVNQEMYEAQTYLLNETEPPGRCDCIYKARDRHCSTFHYSNPDVPKYGIHDIARIGSNPKRLKELVDVGVFSLDDLPADIKLTKAQSNQVRAYRTNEAIIDKEAIASVLGELTYPLHFIDYETFASALPLFSNYSPYDQIPLQYSVHIVGAPDETPIHLDFLHSGRGDPTGSFLSALRGHVGTFGSLIAWNKGFECHVNDKIARRLPSAREYIIELNDRFYDLMEIFSNQHFVHKNLYGSVSIKKVLPVIAPDLSYSQLGIQDGATASLAWRKIVSDEVNSEDYTRLRTNLTEYCALDSYAMYAIWRALTNLIRDE